MSGATPAQHPKKIPATLTGNGGVFQLDLAGIASTPTSTNCNRLEPDLTRFAKLLLQRPKGIACADGRLIGCTHLPNKARALRLQYSIAIETVRIPAPTADKPNGWYGRYRVSGDAKRRLEALLAGV